jgi:hypothetical protein
MSDIFGHIPRKKKDSYMATGMDDSARGTASGSNNLPSIPRKKNFSDANLLSTSSSHDKHIPRKKIKLESNINKTTSDARIHKSESNSSSFDGRKSENDSNNNHNNDRTNRIIHLSIKKGSTDRSIDRSQNSRSAGGETPRSKAPDRSSMMTSRSSFKENIAAAAAITATTVESFTLPTNDRFRVISYDPLVLKIKVHDIPVKPTTVVTAPRNRTKRQSSTTSSISSSHVKPNRSVYQELEDTDSEDYMTTQEEQELDDRRLRKRLKKKSSKALEKASSKEMTEDSDDVDFHENTAEPTGQEDAAGATPDSVPPGTISSLWYSREEFLNIYVLEKVCGWKKRPKQVLFEIVDGDNDIGSGTSTTKLHTLPHSDAMALQQILLLHPNLYADAKIRMEVSRINPTYCPVVATLTEIVSNLSTHDQSSTLAENIKAMSELIGKKLICKIQDETEEVLLVKWRGRS